MGVCEWLKHAFAVGSGEEPPSEEEIRLLDRLAVELVRRELTIPAITFVEMVRPLTYLSSQAMHFFDPVISGLFGAEDYRTVSRLLERREAIDLLCQRIEEWECRAEESDGAR